jgi:hypothetical protein
MYVVTVGYLIEGKELVAYKTRKCSSLRQLKHKSNIHPESPSPASRPFQFIC